MRDIIPMLNASILELAPEFEARDMAPETLAELEQSFRDTGKLIVWAGASNRTVYRDAHVNHAFRAWHDAHHIALKSAFDQNGEAETCLAQLAELKRRFPCVDARALRLIDAEINGQARYFATHGAFPADQVQFTLEAANNV